MSQQRLSGPEPTKTLFTAQLPMQTSLEGETAGTLTSTCPSHDSPTTQCREVRVSCSSLASCGLYLFCIFETSKPLWSQITGTRGQMPPQKPSGEDHLLSIPPTLGSTFQILLCRGRCCPLGVGLGLGILAVETACQTWPRFLEGGASLTGTDVPVRAQPGKAMAAESPPLRACQSSLQTQAALSTCTQGGADVEQRGGKPVLEGNQVASLGFWALPLSPLWLCSTGIGSEARRVRELVQSNLSLD